MSRQCAEIRELLSPYIDDQVSPAERSAVESHLRDCPECTGELVTLRETIALLQRMPQLATPRSFTLETPQPRSAAIFGFLRAGSALAAAAFVLLLTLDVVRSGVLPMGGVGFSSSPVTNEANQQRPAVPQVASKKADAPPSGSAPAAAPGIQSSKQEFRGSEQSAGGAAPAPPSATSLQAQEASPATADSAQVHPDAERLAPSVASAPGPSPEPPAASESTASSGPESGLVQSGFLLRAIEAFALALALATGGGAIWLRRTTSPANGKRRRRS